MVESAFAPPSALPTANERNEHLARARDKARAASPRGPELPPADAELFAALKEWRGNLARASGVPAFVIFHDKTLAAVAGARPRTRRQLLDVPGIGKVKVERHGDELLELIGKHSAATAH